MFVAACQGLVCRGVTHITAVTSKHDDRWPEAGASLEHLSLPGLFMYASWSDSVRFVWATRRHAAFCMIGADVLDGHYSLERSLHRIALVALASRAGLDTRIFGFSFNESAPQEIKNAFRNLPSNVRLCARDPVSRVRIANDVGRDVELVADLAFLLKSDENSPLSQEVIEWINERRAQSHLIVGVSLNGHVLKSNKEVTIAELLASYAAALHCLAQEQVGVSLVLLPHDFRNGDKSDYALLRRLLDLLPEQMRQSSRLLEPPFTAAQVKGISGHLDFAVTGRMHLAIACLGRGTPVVCISYQGKLEGLADYFEIRKIVLSPSEACDEVRLGGVVRWVAANREILRVQINARLARVSALSEQNFT